MNYNLDKRLEHEIISLAKSFGIKKLILFGSRARGTNHARSDIDLAASGGDISEFAFEVDEKLETLLSFDVVNLDGNLDEDFRAEISRDGIILYEEAPTTVTKYNSFVGSLSVLLKSNKDFSDEIYRMGIIGQFNLTFELAWKALREVLLLHGVSEAKNGSPRQIIKAGFKFDFLSDEEIWLDMLNPRKSVTHIYKEDLAEEVTNLICDKYISAFINLRDELKKRIEEAQ